MIELIPARPEMAAMISPQHQQLATGQIMTRDHLAAAINAGLALACVEGSRILAVGGIAEQWPDRGLLWGLLTDGIGATMTPVHRIVQRAVAASSLQRIEMHVAVKHGAAARWAKLLGFKQEGVMRKFWQGHDFALYAKVR